MAFGQSDHQNRGSLSLPFVVDAVPSGAQTSVVHALPTTTPVPLRGLSAQAQPLALRAPTPTSTVQPRSFAVVATNGVNLNLRGGPGLDTPIVGSAIPGEAIINGPNAAWVGDITDGDITYLVTDEGFCYLVLLTDVYSRYIVGFDLSPSLCVEGAERALDQAIKAQKEVPEGFIHHSDRILQDLTEA